MLRNLTKFIILSCKNDFFDIKFYTTVTATSTVFVPKTVRFFKD